MAIKRCVFCGYETGLFAFSDVELVEPSQFYKNSFILPIPGAEKNYGFCMSDNRCALQLNKLLWLLHKFEKIPTPPGLAADGFRNANPHDILPEASDAIKFCKKKIKKIPDPAIKAEVERYISMGEDILAKHEANSRVVFEECKNLQQQALSFRNTFDPSATFSSSDGTWLGCDNSFLYIDPYTNNKISSLMNNRGFIAAKLCINDDNKDLLNTSFIYGKIRLENIIYFKEVGQVEHLTKISGGEMSGGGVNMQGASTGAFWFGAAGAMIGSQIGTEIKQSAIKTNVETLDSRQISLRYKDSSGKITEKIFPYDCYPFFMHVMPEKEFSIVNLESQKSEAALPPKQESTSTSPFEEIKKFKELLDCGIITEEEFAAKKKELLGI